MTRRVAQSANEIALFAGTQILPRLLPDPDAQRQGEMSGLRTHKNLDATRVINDFVASVAEPRRPLHCTTFLHGCLMTLQWKDSGPANVEILRAQHHDLYNACIALLTVPRPHEEFEYVATETMRLRKDVQEALETCHCNTEDGFIRQIHMVSDAARSDKGKPCSYSDLGQLLFVVVHNALQPARDGSIHKVSRNAEKAARAGKPIMWPTKSQDLLPYGAKESMDALIVWVEITPYAVSLGMLGSMMEICKKQIVPYIVVSGTLADKLAGITEIVWMVWIVQQQAPRSTAVTPTKCLADLKSIALFCHMLADLCYEAELKKFAAGSVERLLGMGDLVLKRLPELQASIRPFSSSAKHDLDYVKTSYATLCTLVHRYFDMPFDSTKYHPLIVGSSLQRMMQEENPLSMSYEVFLRFANHQRCYAPACPETFASAGRKFSNCAGCKRVPYCGKKCQAQAWKYATVPHKNICKKLRSLAEITSLPSKPDPTEGPAFVQTCIAKGVDEAVAADVAIHMKNLLKEMNAATCTAPLLQDFQS